MRKLLLSLDVMKQKEDVVLLEPRTIQKELEPESWLLGRTWDHGGQG
jgi:hypothetical protein